MVNGATMRGSLGAPIAASAMRAVNSVTDVEDGMSDITDDDSSVGAPKKLDSAFGIVERSSSSSINESDELSNSMGPPAPRVPKKVGTPTVRQVNSEAKRVRLDTF